MHAHPDGSVRLDPLVMFWRKIDARLNPSADYERYIKQAFDPKNKNVTGDVPKEDEPIDFSRAYAAFPKKYGKEAELKEEAAAQRLISQGALIRSRVRGESRDFSLDQPEWSNLESQAGLSVEEAKQIVSRQRRGFHDRKRTTIPASSALCGMYRVRRLNEYTLPLTVQQAGRSGFAAKKVLLWASPQSANEFRLMQYRRNSHVDCDIVAAYGKMTPGQAIAIALQSILLWLGEQPNDKASRRRNTCVYVGRIGSPDLVLAWHPGIELDFKQVLTRLTIANLILAGGAEGEFPRNEFITSIPNYDESSDIQAYEAAAGRTSVQWTTEPEPEPKPKTKPEPEPKPEPKPKATTQEPSESSAEDSAVPDFDLNDFEL